jgi:membrane fusion protein (multidrug efflux system)
MKRLMMILMVAGLFLMGCDQAGEADQEEFVGYGDRNVRVATARQQDISLQLRYAGRLEAERFVNIAPSIPAKINSIKVKEGDWVEKGDILIEMDNTNLAQIRAQFENLEKNYLRMKQLLQKEAIDKSTFDEIESAYLATKANYENIKENTILTAPFAGVVTFISQKEGEQFNSMASPALIRIADLSKMKAKLSIPDTQINLIKWGDPAIITSDSHPDEQFIGKITMVSQEAEQMSGKFRTEIAVDNPDNKLRHNQFARITIQAKTSENAIVVPPQAVLEEKFAFVVTNGTVERREVKTGLENEHELEIIEGIAAEESVVVTGNVGLSHGDRIRIMD